MSEIRGVHATSTRNSLQDLLHPCTRQVVVWSGETVFQHAETLALKQGEEVQAGLRLKPNHAPLSRVTFHSLQEHEACPLTLARWRDVEEVEPRRGTGLLAPAAHAQQRSLCVSRRVRVLACQPAHPIGAVDTRPLGTLRGRVLAVRAVENAVEAQVHGKVSLMAIQLPEHHVIHGPRRRWGPSGPPNGQGNSQRPSS